MQRHVDDELSKIDDIAALLITARSLSVRFDDQSMRDVAKEITRVLTVLIAARDRKSSGFSKHS